MEAVKLKITRDNVYSITGEGSKTALPRTDDEVTKLGGVFYKPVGQKLKILFENRGGRDFVNFTVDVKTIQQVRVCML